MENVLTACAKDEVQGLSKIHLASKRGDTKTVRRLLRSSANVDALDKEHNTPLHYASQNGHVDVVNLLLSKKTCVYSRDTFGQTSLHPAAKHGHARIAEKLTCNYANVDACNSAKMTALHLACRNGHASIVKILLDNHATVDVMKQSVKTPFYLAAKNGHADVTDLLLSRGVCDFVLAEDKKTPLHAAVTKGHTEVVEVILKHCSGISGNLINCQHRLQENTSNLNKTCGVQPILLLRSNGRRLSAGIVWSEENKPLEIWEDSVGRTALDIAAESAQPKMVKLLINAGQGTYSARHLGKCFNHLRESLSFIPDPFVRDCRKNNDTSTDQIDTEYYEMFFKNIKEIAQVLISSNKFNVNYQNADGVTPIFKVIRSISHEEVMPDEKISLTHFMQLLLEKGADFNVKNFNAETPLMIASMNGCCDVIQILFDWEQKSGMKLDVDARDQYGETALIKAAEMNHVSVMRLLLSHKTSVNLCDYRGFAALHAAIYERKRSWFDLQFFWKDLRKQNIDSASISLETSSREQLQLRGEITDPHLLIDLLQCHIEFVEGTILSRGDVPNHMQRESGDPHIVFDRLLSNLRLRLEAVKLLLENDETDVNARDYRGYAPLDLAMESVMEINSTSLKASKNYGAIRKFKDAPLEVARIDDRGRNPFQRLIVSCISDCLFDNPTDEHKDEDQLFDLIVKEILLNPEDFRESATATDYKGRTPLHYAAMELSIRNSFESSGKLTIRMLLDIGSEVNAADIYGKAPLHYAEEDDKYELLVRSGADENMKDNFGNKPGDLKQLRDLVTTKDKNAWNRPNKDLYLPADTALEINTNHVTKLNRRKLVETIRIDSQSPRPKESSEEAIWKIWTENEFIRLNRRLSQIKPSVKRFMERLADGIKEKDWRFECQTSLVGSSEEETKVSISGDFDYNFRLIKFSQLCDPFPHPLGPMGYFELRRKTNEDMGSRSDEMFASFFNFDNCLLTDEVNSRFKTILEEVLSDPDLWKGEHLFDWNMKHEYISSYGKLDGLCTNIRLKLLDPIADGEGGFLFLNISLDIVACVHVKDWWPKDMSPAVKADGSTFVFDRPNVDLCRSLGFHFVFSRTFARISFAPLESRVIKESSPLIKSAYMVCKMILYLHSGTTYHLKTCLLFCIEALNDRIGNKTKVEDNIAPKQLAFWVERIMYCIVEFSRLRVFPLYFMPSFRQELKNLFIFVGHIFKRRKNDEVNRDLILFSYSKSCDLYLDLCPDDTAIDLTIEHSESQNKSMDRDSNNDPLMELFKRDDFIRLLSSRRSH